MPEITTLHEKKRGCGYRQGGGIYLVSGALGETCWKLPLEMTVCPCCSQGIKPARAFTWVDHKIVSAVECPGDPGTQVMPGSTPNNIKVREFGPDYSKGHGCKSCHGLCGFPERLGLIWIGGKYYPTPEAFSAEAVRMGVSRRIPAVPKDFVVGETVILLGHRKCQFKVDLDKVKSPEGYDVKVEAEGYEDRPGIFRTFIPEKIEYCVKGDETEEELEALEKRGFTLVKIVEVKENEELELQD